MKILLTGATGYLGSRLARRLIGKGHTLGCIVRYPESLGRLESLRERVTLLPIEQLENEIALFRPEIVINTACTYSKKESIESDILSGNLIFPLQVMWAVKKTGVRRWINTDTSLPSMLNSYALSKSQLVQWGAFYAEAGEFEFINLSLEHFYGPDTSEENFILWAIQKLKRNDPLALSAGTQKRDFIYIDDVLSVYEAVIYHSFEKSFEKIEVGTGEAPTIREVVEYLKAITHSKSLLNFGAIPIRKGESDSHCNTEQMLELGIGSPTDWQVGMKLLVNSINGKEQKGDA